MTVHMKAPHQVPQMPPERAFCRVGESAYALSESACGVVLQTDRLRRSSHELIGELVVRCNGNFPKARTFANGILSAGDLNFSSVQARTTRAKLLAERANNTNIDWYGMLEEFAVSVLQAERQGKPAVVLAETEEHEEHTETWIVEGFPILRELPLVLYGDSAAGKSYLALWLAGQLAQREGISILYADWEFSEREHRKRLGRLFSPMPKGVIYVRCEQPIKYEIDHLLTIVRERHCQLVICDSIGFAVEGSDSGFGSDGPTAFFRAVRQLKVGTLNLAHIPKPTEDRSMPDIFGSVFWRHGARSVWYIERAKDEDTSSDEMRLALQQRKSNLGRLLAPVGMKFLFGDHRIVVTPFDVADDRELSNALPILTRLKRALQGGALTRKALAEATNLPMATLRAVLSRHKASFVFLDNNRVGLADMHHQEPPARGLSF